MEGERNKRGVDKMLVNTSSSYKDKMKEQQKKLISQSLIEIFPSIQLYDDGDSLVSGPASGPTSGSGGAMV